MFGIFTRTLSTNIVKYVGTPTCHSISCSIPFHPVALFPLSVHPSTYRPRQQQLNHHSKLAPSLSTSTNKENGHLQPGLHLTSHTYQFCQPANGRADWTAGDQNIRRQFWPMRFGCGPERYTEQGIEAPSQESGFPPCLYLQRCSRHPSLFPNMKTHLSDLYP